VLQQIAGELENFVVYTQRIFLRINWWQNFENRSTFAKVIIRQQGVYFLRHSVIAVCLTQLY